MNAAEEIMATIPEGIRPAAGSGALPPGVEAGHRYSYRCGSRMGVVYAQASGAFTLKPGGVGADWITRNAAAADFTHAPLDCKGCGR